MLLLRLARKMPCCGQRNRNGWNIGDLNPAALLGQLENGIDNWLATHPVVEGREVVAVDTLVAALDNGLGEGKILRRLSIRSTPVPFAFPGNGWLHTTPPL